MNDPSKMLMIIPTYTCNNHCQYCMYHDWTYHKQASTVDYLINASKQLIDKYDFNGFATGGGGDLLLMGYDYCTELVTQLEQIIPPDKYITVLTNIHSEQDVQYLESLNTNHRIRLNISLNFERPNNANTIKLIKTFSDKLKANTRISTVVLDSIINYGYERYLDLINQLGVQAVLFNQFEKTTQTQITRYPTDLQYFQFMYDLITYWINHKNQYSFDLPQATDFLYNFGVCGLVDVIIDPQSIKVAGYNHNRTRRLTIVKDIDQIDNVIKNNVRSIFDYRCMMCRHIAVCDHKYTQTSIDERVCDLIDQTSTFVHNHLTP